MSLSIEQESARRSINRFLNSIGSGVFVLAGYAGTGKTFLLQHIVNDCREPVLCLAPTGKAASVLQRKLDNARVSTVHSAIYKPVAPGTKKLDALLEQLELHPDNKELIEAIELERERLSKARVNFALKEDRPISPGQFVVVDEASMVDKRMFEDLVKTGAKILFVGDPGQLPPVSDAGFFTTHKPDAVLNEVQRQALDSPIIRVSMEIREGKLIKRQNTEGFKKMAKEDFNNLDWLTFDQVLTGMNETRRKVNKYFRKHLNRKGWWPQEGEKLICLKNNYDNDPILVNGIVCSTLSDSYMHPDFEELCGELLYDGVPANVQFYRYPFNAHYDQQAVDLPWQLRQHLSEFDYGYAITVHKSQGSEWDRVLLADDGMRAGDTEFRKKFLYTAVTRARKELVWLF